MIKTNMVTFTGMLISIIGIISALALPSLGSLANAQIGGNVGNNKYSFGNSSMNTNTSGGSMQNASGMDFGGMNLSRLFDGTSFLGTIGVSMVNGVKVTGLNLPADNQVSVTLKNTNASIGGANMTSPAVTVIAIRAAMSSKDIMSLMAASSNQNGGNASNMMTMMNSMNMMKSMQGRDAGTSSSNSSNSLGNNLANSNATFPGSNFNPMSFLENLQMGSTSLVNPNWKVPQTITMGLIGNPLSSGFLSSATLPPAAEFIIAVVIPYTGQANLTTP
jgi:hypothetical protein